MEAGKLKGLIMSYFLSRYDRKACDILGCKTFIEAFKIAADVTGENADTIRFDRDYFDPYFPNKRKGWDKYSLDSSKKFLLDYFADMGDPDMFRIIRHILNRESDPIFDTLSKLVDESKENSPNQILKSKDELKDLGKLITAIQQNLADHYIPAEIQLSDNFKKAYTEYALEKGETVTFNTATAVVTNANAQKIYAANQWFVMAAYAVPLIQELIIYRNHCEDVMDNFPALQTYMTQHHMDKASVFHALKEKPEKALLDTFAKGAADAFTPLDDADRYGQLLVRFATDYSWWLGEQGLERIEDYYVSPVLRTLGLSNTYQSFIASLTYAYASTDSLYQELPTMIAMEDINAKQDTAKADIPRNTGGSNILLYGVPGCGKSYQIKTRYCDEENYMERVVFHPDYTNSDFIGQIMPVNEDGKISYPFIPGPFTRILKAAVNDPTHLYFLVIEEINRGNAPAIFGEVFQLLDRVNGESEYGISNADISRIVYGNPKRKVKIPSNLILLATMNTADQNVFTLDTAFKRRWRMENIPNDFSKCKFATHLIAGTKITWSEFATAINKKIVEFGKGNGGSEDARLGAYFVTDRDLEDSKSFAEKVLMYLWEDAFKFNRNDIFNKEYDTPESLLQGFESKHLGVFSNAVVFEKFEVDQSPSSDDTAESTQSSDVSTQGSDVSTNGNDLDKDGANV